MDFKFFNQVLDYQANHNKDDTVFTYLENGEDEKESLSFHELSILAKRISGYLQSFFQPDERVILLLPNDLTFIYSTIGCMYAGLIPIPLHPINNYSTLTKCKYVIKDASTNIILSTRKVYQSISKKYEDEVKDWDWILIDEIGESHLEKHKELSFPQDKVAFLQYTSGSTSNPKGVRVTHKSLLTNLANIQESFSIGKDDIILSWLPFFHDMGIIAIVFESIFVGVRCILFPPLMFLQSPLRWVRAISKYKATVSGAPNFAYDLCSERIMGRTEEGLDLSSWGQAFCGAEPVKVETFQRFCKSFTPYGFSAGAFYPGYGMAEATLLISGGERGIVPRVIKADRNRVKENIINLSEDGIPIISCGKCISSHEIKIVHPNTQIVCKENEIGEIWFTGPSVADGYYNKDSNKVFKSRINGLEKDEYLKTGDLGFLHEGELYVTGRLKEIIIVNGLNYYPKDIEEVVESKEVRIRENCSAVFEISNGEKTSLAYLAEVRRQYMNDINLEDLTVSIRTVFSEQIGLKVDFIGVLATGKLPKTTSGKIQRTLYQRLISERKIQLIYEWRNEIRASLKGKPQGIEAVSKQDFKQWLRTRVSEVLNLDKEKINPDNVLNNYGLDSVSATGLSGEIEQYVKQPVSPTLLYNYPSINLICEFLFSKSLKNNDLSINQIQNRKKSSTSEIAIVGFAFRFPSGIDNKEDFWRMLENKGSGIKSFPSIRNVLQNTCNPGGYIDKPENFDAQFFKISEREAIQMDPQHRLLLETSYHAFEDANIDIDEIAGSNTGVFIGIGNGDYYKNFQNKKELLNAYSGVGNSFAIAANRISYFYNLKGPSLSVDTACSSSLVATHLGINSLLNGESGMAVVGGVNLILDNSLDQVFQQAGMLSPDFLCKTFDKSANGYVRGEGAGVVLLKRLEDAIEQGDNIHAIIKGSAINQDGTTNGITAPNGNSQQKVIREALNKANIEPKDLTYIETHGTGTSLGDPIEVNALAELFEEREEPCYLGAVKANIGHLEFAAGIAGLIKTILCLKQKKIPGNSNLRSVNPLIESKNQHILINRDLVDWNPKAGERFAGVSSFGFGGTNAHVILKESTETSHQESVDNSNRYVLSLSAKTPESLKKLREKYLDFLAKNNLPIGNICYTSNVGRKHFTYRLAVSGCSNAQLIDELQSQNIANILPVEEISKIAFLFTGQGSQYIGMGESLYRTFPLYKKYIDHCAAILERYLDIPLTNLLFDESNNDVIHQTKYSQVAIFSLEYSLSKLLLSWGIQPDVLMGHSIGEYAAACIANVFSLEDALKMVYHRGIYMQEAPGEGVMYSVFGSHEKITKFIKDELSVSIAAYNDPNQIVLSGQKSNVEGVVAKLSDEGISSLRLNVSHAFHSELMRPAAEKFLIIAKQITYSKPTYKIVSNLTGTCVNDEVSTAGYWCRQILESVQFSKGVKTIKDLKIKTCVEVGPQPVLNSLIAQNSGESKIMLSCLRKSELSTDTIIKTVAALYEMGVNINWKELYTDKFKKVNIPNYPFHQQSYWISRQKQEFFSPIEEFDKGKLFQRLVEQGNYSEQELALLPKLLESIKGFNNQDKRQLEQIEELFYQHTWIEKVISTTIPVERPERIWVIVSDTYAEEEGLFNMIAEREEEVVRIHYNELFEDSTPRNFAEVEEYKNKLHHIIKTKIGYNPYQPIIFLFALTDCFSGSVDEQLSNKQDKLLICISAISHFAKVKENQVSGIWMLTKNGIGTEQDEQTYALPVFSTMWGVAKTLSLEHTDIFNGIINYSENSDQIFLSILDDLFFEKEEQYINYISGKRYVYRIEKGLNRNKEGRSELQFHGNYIITGGLGSLGLQVAKWLTEKGASKIFLLTRRSCDDPEILRKAADIKSGKAEIVIQQCDIRSKKDVDQLFEIIKTSKIVINGLINAAGIAEELAIEETSLATIHEIVTTKTLGTWLLFDVLKNEPLDFFINFSSISSAWGSSGQMLYSAANHFLDSITYYFRSLGVKAFSINWGAWDQSNMLTEDFKSKLEKAGVLALNPVDAVQAMEEVIKFDCMNPIVASVNWERFHEVYSWGRKRPLLAHLYKEKPILETRHLFIDRIKAFDNDMARMEHLKEELQQMTKELLGHNNEQMPSTVTGFFEMGFDSIMSLELKNKLEKLTGVKLPNTLLFERPNIKLLASHLFDVLELGNEVINEFGEKQDFDNSTTMENLSETELANLLLSELNKDV